MNKQKIILFDIDYTLFDTTKFKEVIAKEIANITHHEDSKLYEILEEVYYEARFQGHFEPSLFHQVMQKKLGVNIQGELEELWSDQGLIKQAIYPEVVSTLKKLQSQNFELGLFSTGNTEYQLAKISLLEDFFQKKHIYIFSNKEEKVEELIKEYKNYPLFIVDDFLSILASAKKIKNDTTTIWINRGKYAAKEKMPVGFFPDFTLTNLDSIPELVDNKDLE